MDKTLINKYITDLGKDIESIDSDIFRLKAELQELENRKQEKINLKDSLGNIILENDTLIKLKPIDIEPIK